MSDVNESTADVKACARCGEVKPVEEFWKRKSSKDGRQGDCRDCARRHHRAKIAKFQVIGIEEPAEKVCVRCGETKPIDRFHRSPITKDGRLQRCMECAMEVRRQRGYRHGVLKTYGLTVASYDALLAKQGGVCAICGQPPNGRSLDVDHCHSTGVVRGLLCNNCNRGVGHLKDDPKLLILAATYLKSKGAPAPCD